MDIYSIEEKERNVVVVQTQNKMSKTFWTKKLKREGSYRHMIKS